MQGMFFNSGTNGLEQAYRGVLGHRNEVGDVSNEVLEKPEALRKADLVTKAAVAKTILGDAGNMFVKFAKDKSIPVTDELSSKIHASFADAIKNVDSIVASFKEIPVEAPKKETENAEDEV